MGIGGATALDRGQLFEEAFRRLPHATGADLETVVRAGDAADERRVLIALTEQGMALRQQARDVPQTLASSLSLSPEELIELRASVQHLVAVLASAEATVSPS